jgi:hypothetical protein
MKDCYHKTLEVAKDLQKEFGNKITLIEALQIATQIVTAQTLADGLQTNDPRTVTFLEAIAMALGYEPNSEGIKSKTVASSLNKLLYKD